MSVPENLWSAIIFILPPIENEGFVASKWDQFPCFNVPGGTERALFTQIIALKSMALCVKVIYKFDP